MTKVIAYDSNIDTTLQQGSGTAVAQRVRRDAPTTQRRRFACGGIGILTQEVSDSIPREGLASMIAEDQIARATIADRREGPQDVGGLTPQRAEPIPAAFSMQANLLRSMQTQVLDANTECFTHPSARIVKEEQQGMIPYAGLSSEIGLFEDKSNVLGFQIGSGRRACLLG